MKMLLALAILATAGTAFATPSPCQIDPSYCDPRPRPSKPCNPNAVETYQFRAQTRAMWTF
jgi:hypothetical protein